MKKILLALLLICSPVYAQTIGPQILQLPLSVAQGGTGDTGTAWTTYTPVATCGQTTGTIVCTMAGRYKILGKTIWFTATNTVSGTFTAGTFTAFTVPFSSLNGAGAAWSLQRGKVGLLVWDGTLH